MPTVGQGCALNSDLDADAVDKVTEEEFWEDLTKTAIRRKLRMSVAGVDDLPVHYKADPLALRGPDGNEPRGFSSHFDVLGRVEQERLAHEAEPPGEVETAEFLKEASLFAGLPSRDTARAAVSDGSRGSTLLGATGTRELTAGCGKPLRKAAAVAPVSWTQVMGFAGLSAGGVRKRRTASPVDELPAGPCDKGEPQSVESVIAKRRNERRYEDTHAALFPKPRAAQSPPSSPATGNHPPSHLIYQTPPPNHARSPVGALSPTAQREAGLPFPGAVDGRLSVQMPVKIAEGAAPYVLPTSKLPSPGQRGCQILFDDPTGSQHHHHHHHQHQQHPEVISRPHTAGPPGSASLRGNRRVASPAAPSPSHSAAEVHQQQARQAMNRLRAAEPVDCFDEVVRGKKVEKIESPKAPDTEDAPALQGGSSVAGETSPRPLSAAAAAAVHVVTLPAPVLDAPAAAAPTPFQARQWSRERAQNSAGAGSGSAAPEGRPEVKLAVMDIGAHTVLQPPPQQQQQQQQQRHAKQGEDTCDSADAGPRLDRASGAKRPFQLHSAGASSSTHAGTKKHPLASPLRSAPREHPPPPQGPADGAKPAVPRRQPRAEPSAVATAAWSSPAEEPIPAARAPGCGSGRPTPRHSPAAVPTPHPTPRFSKPGSPLQTAVSIPAGQSAAAHLVPAVHGVSLSPLSPSFSSGHWTPRSVISHATQPQQQQQQQQPAAPHTTPVLFPTLRAGPPGSPVQAAAKAHPLHRDRSLEVSNGSTASVALLHEVSEFTASRAGTPLVPTGVPADPPGRESGRPPSPKEALVRNTHGSAVSVSRTSSADAAQLLPVERRRSQQQAANEAPSAAVAELDGRTPVGAQAASPVSDGQTASNAFPSPRDAECSTNAQSTKDEDTSTDARSPRGEDSANARTDASTSPREDTSTYAQSPRGDDSAGVETPGDEASTNALSPREKESGNTRTPRDEASTNALSPREETSTYAQSPREEESADAETPRDDASTNALSPREEASTCAQSPGEEASANAETPREEVSTNALSPREETSTYAQSPREEESADTQTPREETSADAQSPAEDPSASAQTPRDEASANAQSPDGETSANARTRAEALGGLDASTNASNASGGRGFAASGCLKGRSPSCDGTNDVVRCESSNNFAPAADPTSPGTESVVSPLVLHEKQTTDATLRSGAAAGKRSPPSSPSDDPPTVQRDPSLRVHESFIPFDAPGEDPSSPGRASRKTSGKTRASLQAPVSPWKRPGGHGPSFEEDGGGDDGLCVSPAASRKASDKPRPTLQLAAPLSPWTRHGGPGEGDDDEDGPLCVSPVGSKPGKRGKPSSSPSLAKRAQSFTRPTGSPRESIPRDAGGRHTPDPGPQHHPRGLRPLAKRRQSTDAGKRPAFSPLRRATLGGDALSPKPALPSPGFDDTRCPSEEVLSDGNSPRAARGSLPKGGAGGRTYAGRLRKRPASAANLAALRADRGPEADPEDAGGPPLPAAEAACAAAALALLAVLAGPAPKRVVRLARTSLGSAAAPLHGGAAASCPHSPQRRHTAVARRTPSSTVEAFHSGDGRRGSFVRRQRRSDSNLAPSAPCAAPISRHNNEFMRSMRGHLEAVVVGIENYNDPRLLPCSQVTDDAVQISNLLRTAGYKVTELHDGPGGIPPIEQNVLRAFSEAQRKSVEPEDVFLFIFIGLGHWTTGLFDHTVPGAAAGQPSPVDLHLFCKDFDVGRQDDLRKGFLRTSALCRETEHHGAVLNAPVVICDTVSCYGSLRRPPGMCLASHNGLTLPGASANQTIPPAHDHPHHTAPKSVPEEGCVYVGGRPSVGGVLLAHCRKRYNFLASFYFKKALLGHATREFRVTTNTFNVYLHKKLKQRGFDCTYTTSNSLNGGDVILLDRFEVPLDRKVIKDNKEHAKTVPCKVTLTCLVSRSRHYCVRDGGRGSLLFLRALHSAIAQACEGKARRASAAAKHLQHHQLKSVARGGGERVPLHVRYLMHAGAVALSLEGSAEGLVLDRRKMRIRTEPVNETLAEAVRGPPPDIAYHIKSGGVLVFVRSPTIHADQGLDDRLQPSLSERRSSKPKLGDYNFVSDPNFLPAKLLLDGNKVVENASEGGSTPPLFAHNGLPRALSSVSSSRRGSNDSQRKRSDPEVLTIPPLTTDAIGGLRLRDAYDCVDVTFRASEWHHAHIDRALRSGELKGLLVPLSLRMVRLDKAREKLERAAATIQALHRGGLVRTRFRPQREAIRGERAERREFEDRRWREVCAMKRSLLDTAVREFSLREEHDRHEKAVWEWEDRELLFTSAGRGLKRVEERAAAVIYAECAVDTGQLEEHAGRLLLTAAWQAEWRWLYRYTRLWHTFASGRDKLEREAKHELVRCNWTHGTWESRTRATSLGDTVGSLLLAPPSPRVSLLDASTSSLNSIFDVTRTSESPAPRSPSSARRSSRTSTPQPSYRRRVSPT
ncbi:hypothetical protein DIPPA_26093 [Diplonema papillatum]|nr:hypothetical protein DIPPA_26093 [Diplonema papillatum]